MNRTCFSYLACLCFCAASLTGPVAFAQDDAEESAMDLTSAASKLLAAGKYAEAIVPLKKLTERSPNQTQYHFTLADARFMNAEMKESVASYDRAIELAPALAPRCWQRGLALYYAEEFEKGKSQFETHQTVNRQDVENSVWHMLCHARIASVEKAREEMIPISGDQRVPMPEVFNLFAGEGTVQQVLDAATAVESESEYQRKQARYYAHLYIGLFQEMVGESDNSLESMRKAVELNPIANGQLMGTVADVHLKLRDPEYQK